MTRTASVFSAPLRKSTSCWTLRSTCTLCLWLPRRSFTSRIRASRGGQHPSLPHMRWLIHTKRVPVLQRAPAQVGAGRPPCAGVGDPEQTAWLCHECASHLCRSDPKMPPQALANWFWGGRLHPLYKDLTMATRTLLGLGRAVMRLVLLKPRDKTDEVEKGLVGNTILVAQPAPQQILSTLPPSEAEQVSYFTSSTILAARSFRRSQRSR